MYEYIKVKNHKGLKELILKKLGKINILCGKNNSGKTSILEALSIKDKFDIGKKLLERDRAFLEEIFYKEIKRRNYADPNQEYCKKFFSNFIDKEIQNRKVWFFYEKEKIINEIVESMSKDTYLNSFSDKKDWFNISSVVDTFFRDLPQKYSTVLLPPKRFLENKIEINSSQNLEANGKGVTNRLFFLKNQDIKSEEYKKYESIYQSFQFVTGNYFNIFIDQSNQLSLNFSKNGEFWINANDSGLGLSDILIMIVFIIDTDYPIICIEEPESHIHPEMQKKFLSFVKERKQKQFIFSTHSNIFIDPNIADRIFYSYFSKNVQISDETSKSRILNNLGYSAIDNLVSDLLILTEGPTDIPVLREIFNWFNLNKKYNISYWSLGGDNMALLDLSVFRENSNVFALIDSDPKSQVVRTRFQRNCRHSNIHCTKLKGYSIENYFTLKSIKKEFPTIGDITELKLDEKVDKQLGLSNKGKSIKEKNHKIIKHMNIADIKDTDLFNFCDEISEFLKSKN